MINKKLSLILGIFLLVFTLTFISAEISYCCERTTLASDSGGAWCQNAPEEDCRTGFKKAPTSCESTSYCKLGTCINVQEGTCAENTPQVVCEDAGGVWDEQPAENLGQCQLGCCAIGEQTAYVTQTRCKRLSSLYGLETNYRTDITSELECIITSQPDIEGACVFSKEFERTCLRTTKAECQEFEASADKEDIEFYEDLLCSDTDLGTNCGPSKETTCVEGEDRIYLLDTCGNLANVYDSTKIDSNGNWDAEYWSRIYEEAEMCELIRNSNDLIANAESCGNCDYYFGSTCQEYDVWKKSQDLSVYGNNVPEPDIGDNICADLACEYDGERYLHGESWCGINSQSFDDFEVPGAESYRYVCYNGEVTIEPCASYRQEVCVPDIITNEDNNIPDYRVAACVANRWQDCNSQINMDDCNNGDERDCEWVNGSTYDMSVPDSEDEKGYCKPIISPGFDFWDSETTSKETCNIASTVCKVEYTSGFFGGHGFLGLKSGEDIGEGKSCVASDGSNISLEWLQERQSMCISLGDCGNDINYFGNDGDYYKEWLKTGDLSDFE